MKHAVMAALVPAIHVFTSFLPEERRGCPGQAKTSPGMTTSLNVRHIRNTREETPDGV
jgi:hypothetical protein